MPFSSSFSVVRDIVATTVLIPILGLPTVAARVNESLKGAQIESTLTTKQIIARVSASLVSVESLNPKGEVLATVASGNGKNRMLTSPDLRPRCNPYMEPIRFEPVDGLFPTTPGMRCRCCSSTLRAGTLRLSGMKVRSSLG